MRAELAEIVHPILSYGLSLRDRLDAGELLQWDLEQATLKEMLAALKPKRTEAEPANDAFVFDGAETADDPERLRLAQKSLRYTLTCWLDEVLGQHPHWEPSWRERTLESTLCGADEGSRLFWEEARYAETRGDRDALEGMFWCVLLGFRGERHSKPDPLEAWVMRVRARLDQANRSWTTPASVAPPTALAAMGEWPGQQRTFALLLTLTLSVPFALVMLWRHWPL